MGGPRLILRKTGRVLVSLLLILVGSVQETTKAQTDSVRAKAVSQMRQIVSGLKQCPEDVSPLLSRDNFAERHLGPPAILEWDVIKSESLRSEFLGFVRFDVPIRLEETEEAKQSSKLDKKYRDFVKPKPWLKPEDLKEMYVIHYRYEFDLGSDGPGLRKALILTGAMKEFTLYDPHAGGSCWDRIARSPAGTPN